MAHSNKHIREAIEYAEANGWRYEEGGKGHTVGKLYCPGRCLFFVHGTPRNPENHARRIRRAVEACQC